MSRDRLAPVLAALATLLTAWSLSAVVEESHWRPATTLMVLGVLVVGLVARALRTPRVLVLPLQALVCGLLVTAVFAGESAVAGVLPGRAAAAELVRLLGLGGEVISRYAAPVPSTRGMTLILALGVLGVALLVDLLVCTLRSPAAAGLPLLALYAVPAAVVPDGLPARYFAAAALGWLLLLAHEASTRVRRWGRLLPRWGGRAPASRTTISNDTAALAATGRRLGVVSIGLAVLVPAVLPGLPDGLLTGSGGSRADVVRGRTSINPVLGLRDSLTAQRDVEVLRYTTAQRDVQPLRILTADRFDGETWQPGARQVARSNRANRGLPDPPGLGPDVPVQMFSMHVAVGPVLDQEFLPLPYPTRTLDIDGTWLFDPTSLNVIGDRESVRGRQYDLTYLAVRPTADQLRRSVPSRAPGLRAFTALPDGLPRVVSTAARRVVAGQRTTYDQALALQQWFRTDGAFSYSTTVPNAAGFDAVAAFLDQRQGYCVQFASAMAVMARTLGIPARIGVGFLPGRPDGARGHVVRLTDAHAWPELYFSGVGWVRFEPTPATRTGVAPAWAREQSTGTSGRPTDPADPQGQTRADDPRVRNLESSERDQSSSALRDPAVAASAPAEGDRQEVLLAAGLGLVLLLAAVTPTVSALARRRRRRQAADARGRVDACWAELHERVVDLGLALPPARTPRQVEHQLTTAVPFTAAQRAALHRLVAGVEQARYARPLHRPAPRAAPGTDGSPAALGADLRKVLRAVAASRPQAARVRARLLPTSGRTRIAAVLRQAQHVLDRGDQWLARSVYRCTPRRLRARRLG